MNSTMQDMELFNLKEFHKEVAEDEEKNMQPIDSLGIKFFHDSSSFTNDSIFSETTLNLDVLSSDTLKDCPSVINVKLSQVWAQNGSTKLKIFSHFFRLLFTKLDEDQLDNVFFILQKLLLKVKTVDKLFFEVCSALPEGLRNLGGNVRAIFNSFPSSGEHQETKPDDTLNTHEQGSKTDIKENLKYILQTLTRVLLKFKIIEKKAVPISSRVLSPLDPQSLAPVASRRNLKGSRTERELIRQVSSDSVPYLDDLVLVPFAVAQDPEVLHSTLKTQLTSLIEVVLELYPEKMYLDKVMDLVDRFGVYWDEVGAFCPRLASIVLTWLFPTSERGQRLRSSLAYYSLCCCFSNEEANILAVVELPYLKSEIEKHTSQLKEMDMVELLVVVQLVNSAISRPVKDCEELKGLITRLVDISNSKKVSWASCFLSAVIQKLNIESMTIEEEAGRFSSDEFDADFFSFEELIQCL